MSQQCITPSKVDTKCEHGAMLDRPYVEHTWPDDLKWAPFCAVCDIDYDDWLNRIRNDSMLNHDCRTVQLENKLATNF